MSKDCYSNINNSNGNNYGTVPPRPPKKGEPNTVTTMSQLNNFVDSRSDVLIGFSESNENKSIFSAETGIEI